MRSTLPLFIAAFAASAPALAIENVAVPGFRSIQLRGGGEVTVRPGPVQRVTITDGSSQFTTFRVHRSGQLRINACEGNCPRHYRLRIEIQSPRVPDLAVSGGGTIRTAGGFGREDDLAVAVNGGGSIDARAVAAANVTAAVNGGGRIAVHPRRSLQAAVSGGGEVRYLGNPQVSMAVNGGGSVRPGS